MPSRFPPRASDEVLLMALALSRAGRLTPGQVARRCGIRSATLATLMRRVSAADLAESGEPHEAVGPAYPWVAS